MVIARERNVSRLTTLTVNIIIVLWDNIGSMEIEDM